MEQFWSFCDIFARMDQQCAGVVRRVDFISAIRELGTDLEFRKVIRKTDLAGRFYANAKDLSLEEFICLTLPRATKKELVRACRWADLWKARRALETCGFKDDGKELRSLFTVLDEDGNGSLSLKELVRAQILSHDEVLRLLQPNRGFDPMRYEDFRKIIGPELCKKYRRQEEDSGLSAIGPNLSKRDVFQKILATLTSSSPDASEPVCTPAAEVFPSASVRPRGLPRLPSSHRERSAYCRSSSLGAYRRSSSFDVSREGATADVSAETDSTATPRSEPSQRFETLRARRARAVCGGGANDELQKYEFLKDCTPLFLRFLLDELQCEMFKPGDVIIKEGDVGDKIYLLRRGEVEILVGLDLRKVADLKEGVAFGEMALFETSGKRSATVRATDLCDCRTLSQRTFMKLLECFPEDKEFFRKVARQRRAQLNKVPEQRSGRRASSEWRKGRNLPSREEYERPASLGTCIAPLVTAN